MKKVKKSPPVIAEKLLDFFLPEPDCHNLLGDYEELFQDLAEEKNRFVAVLWYWFQLILTIPSFFFESFIWSLIMIKNYLKITFRTLLKHKGFSIINITGLALSISICLIIILFIKDQKSSNQFHEKKDRIYRVYTTDNKIRYSEVKGWATSPGPLAPILLNNYSGVEDAVRIRKMRGNVLFNETAISISGFFAEPSFFNLFSYILRKGDPATALTDPYSIVISQKTANKFFGNENPINKTLSIETYGDFKITGVLKDFQLKSHMEFEVIISFATIHDLQNREIFRNPVDKWTSYGEYYTYILLDNINSVAQLAAQIPETVKTIFPENELERFNFRLQPLLKINLGINLINPLPGTKHSFEIIFIPFVAAIIIFLACFNYINLSIARSLKRIKEIGVRQVIGARRNQIIKLFFTEAFMVTFIALAMAFFFILWLIPALNGLNIMAMTNTQINLSVLKDFDIYIIFLIFAVIVSLIAGSYPTIYLSSFLPVNALKGVLKIKSSSRFLTRKILIVMQFAVSTAAIIVIIFIYKQHLYMMSYEKGINTDHIVNVNLQNANYETLKNEFKTNNDVIAISMSSDIPIYGSWGRTNVKSEALDEAIHLSYYAVDTDFLDNFGLSLITGRNFSDDFTTDTSYAAMINEKAVNILGFNSPEDALGKAITVSGRKNVVILGVLKDFNFKSLESPIAPLVLQYRPKYFNYANIRFSPGKKNEIKSYLLNNWKRFDKVHPLECEFFDDLEETESSFFMGVIKITGWACGFVILIALLGLLGMTTYNMELRVKEIGIRKVLGASVSGIVMILSKDFIKMIAFAGALGIPLSWLISTLFFQVFAYRINLSIWVFLGGLLFIVILALLTISTQTVKAAFTNPVDSIREE